MYNTRIEMTQTRLIKNPDTKTTYLIDEEKKGVISKRQYKNITNDDTIKFFRRLGGTETVERGYTSQGYLIYKLTSTSPDRQMKTIREFKFIEDKRYKYHNYIK